LRCCCCCHPLAQLAQLLRLLPPPLEQQPPLEQLPPPLEQLPPPLEPPLLQPLLLPWCGGRPASVDAHTSLFLLAPRRSHL
jgi:hypothetical protein